MHQVGQLLRIREILLLILQDTDQADHFTLYHPPDLLLLQLSTLIAEDQPVHFLILDKLRPE